MYFLIKSRKLLLAVGDEIRDKFSGAVEAFAKRNSSGSGHHGDNNSKHRIHEDSPISSKDVSFQFILMLKILLWLNNN